MADISLDKLWEWWRQLASRELSLERQYKPLISEYEAVHRKRQALENLMAAQGEVGEGNQQISAEWEKLRRGEELPLIERRPPDVAYDTLVRTGSPMHYKSILAELSKEGVVIGGRDPGSTLIAYLGRDKRFVKAKQSGRGYYQLAEWGTKKE